MSVHKSARGLGIAQCLVQHAITHSKAQGFQTLFLTTTNAQQPAIRLYLKMGWKVTKAWTDGVIRMRQLTLWL
jgi:ribosomal protein S18 acetylase RimI-like enzyme